MDHPGREMLFRSEEDAEAYAAELVRSYPTHEHVIVEVPA
jgi:hypothetical protein